MKKKPQLRRNDLLIKFGEKLKEVRNREGLSQEALALKAGVSSSSIARIEKGKINTTISTALHIAEKMNVPFTDLFEFEGSQVSSEETGSK